MKVTIRVFFRRMKWTSVFNYKLVPGQQQLQGTVLDKQMQLTLKIIHGRVGEKVQTIDFLAENCSDLHYFVDLPDLCEPCQETFF